MRLLGIFGWSIITLSVEIQSVQIRRVITSNHHVECRKTLLRNFVNSALSGAISCSVTHSLVCPLDVVKTKIQTDVTLKGKSTFEAFQQIVKSGGKGILLQGLSATFSGYAMQGFCKFGFYDLIKSKAYGIIKDREAIVKYRLPILLVSSGLAEIIASWALCPMEVTRIFMVTNPHFKSSVLTAMKFIVNRDGISGLFKGLPIVMLRQVPYTCTKLAGYEIISDALTKLLNDFKSTEQKNSAHAIEYDHKVDKCNTILIQLSSGVLAGVLAAMVSHPADVLMARICGGGGTESLGCLLSTGPMGLIEIFKSLGLRNCYAGLQSRAIMVGSLTAMQFMIYEQTKSMIVRIRKERGN